MLFRRDPSLSSYKSLCDACSLSRTDQTGTDEGIRAAIGIADSVVDKPVNNWIDECRALNVATGLQRCILLMQLLVLHLSTLAPVSLETPSPYSSPSAH